MTARSLWLYVVAALALPGCMYPGGGSWSSSSSGWGSSMSPWDTSGTPATLDVQAGHQAGAMGDIRAFDADAMRLQGTKDSTSTYVQLDSLGAGWWVMTAFDFNVDIDTLVPGQTYYADSLYVPSSSSVTTMPSGAMPVSVDVRGCSGPSDGDYTFDDLATHATFQVEVLASGLRRVHYDCAFVSDAGTTQDASGYFDYTPGSSGSTASGPSVDVRGI